MNARAKSDLDPAQQVLVVSQSWLPAGWLVAPPRFPVLFKFPSLEVSKKAGALPLCSSRGAGQPPREVVPTMRSMMGGRSSQQQQQQQQTDKRKGTLGCEKEAARVRQKGSGASGWVTISS